MCNLYLYNKFYTKNQGPWTAATTLKKTKWGELGFPKAQIFWPQELRQYGAGGGQAQRGPHRLTDRGHCHQRWPWGWRPTVTASGKTACSGEETPLLHPTHEAYELRLEMQTPGRTTPLLDINSRKKLSTWGKGNMEKHSTASHDCKTCPRTNMDRETECGIYAACPLRLPPDRNSLPWGHANGVRKRSRPEAISEVPTCSTALSSYRKRVLRAWPSLLSHTEWGGQDRAKNRVFIPLDSWNIPINSFYN